VALLGTGLEEEEEGFPDLLECFLGEDLLQEQGIEGVGVDRGGMHKRGVYKREG
jgi:hypothetical protein